MVMMLCNVWYLFSSLNEEEVIFEVFCTPSASVFALFSIFPGNLVVL